VSGKRALMAGWLALLAACGGGGDDGLPEDYPRPVVVSDTLRFADVQASQGHTCGLALDGSTSCWGVNGDGELGTSAALDLCDIPGIVLVSCTGTPQAVAGAPVLTQLTLTGGGAGHTCGLDAEGRAWCWGFGEGGQLGDGLRTSSSAPVAVAGEQRFERLRSSISGESTCGVMPAGSVWCWGVGPDGLWGTGIDYDAASVPKEIAWSEPIAEFDLGQMHGCGISAAGQAWCWGNNWYGQLGAGSAGGDGGLAKSATPLPVAGGHLFRAVSTGLEHSCALDDDGAAWCWGSSSVAVAPVGEVYVGTPQPVPGGLRFVSIRAGMLHACGLTALGEAWCWGQNYGGELGNGTREPGTTPVRVDAPVRFARLSHRPVCAVTAEGEAWCWGSNLFGQVGRPSRYAQ
jgi:alpha-tubulin suppressor-like RCC1 family protein